MTDLKPCPCGQTPDQILIFDQGHTSKWMYVSGSCCAEWMVEFRSMYNIPESDECIKLAIDAWNGAPRSTRDQELEAQVEQLKETISVMQAIIEHYKTTDAQKSWRP